MSFTSCTSRKLKRFFASSYNSFAGKSTIPREKHTRGDKNEARRDQKVHRGNAGCGGYASAADYLSGFAGTEIE